MFNSKGTAEPAALGDHCSTCVILDDVLADPEGSGAPGRATARRIPSHRWQRISRRMPGSARRTHRSLGDFFARSVRRHFNARRIVSMHCRLSMVTLPPAALRPFQWLCHRDGESIAPGQSIQASILYLFRDERLGGTSFYEPARSVAEIATLFADSKHMGGADFTARYGLQPGYIQHSNGYFRCLGSVPARWNRMIFYDGSMLHSGDIGTAAGCSADPLTGRLTLNGFFTSKRNAQ
jgi:hypothetical protein